ncbi:ATP-binding cassette domain-containing protein [Mycobacterium avium]|uniref:ATP-binding cassette domain-containing protein n=1 Tax=Mycobacterium avium TaxID=1764 RepID=UPI0005AD399C|nr:ATP-binding cassette domain-containing protein [Mycobacterium avium]AJK79235.1 ABC transporter [Mycobacterium avium subsp. paratuberculosis]
MPTEASALPASLTVWAGPSRYVFAPGRDVVVGYGPGCDIPLERLAPQPPPAPRVDVVLRFTGAHWVAIDLSHRGIFLDGSRVPTVEIRDGLAITIEDPGPTAPPPVPPPPPPAPPPAPPAPAPEPPKGPGLIERMITSKLRAQRPSFRTDEANSTHRLPLRTAARTTGVVAYQLGLSVDGHETLSGISFTAKPGTMTAVIGPSPARNAALLALLAGTRTPSSGRVTVDGHDVHAEPAAMRARIGVVSREERLHRRLTVEQALRYAAELRLPPETSAEQRDRVVGQVLDELDLTTHRDTRIRKLAPEVRRCTALAIELVTRPSLLVVDEPTAGLNAAQQRHVMAVLRRQANLGCVVVAAISSRTSLTDVNMCDQVLVLTAAGKVAYLGTPLQAESAMGSADWSAVLARVGADPDGAHRAFRARPQSAAPTIPPEVAAWAPPAALPVPRQVRCVARREIRLLLANRLYFAFLALLPFVLAGLTLLIPGDSGLARPAPSSANAHEAIEILALLNVAAVIIGTALTVPAMVGEHRVYRREQQVGLSAPAYLAAKIAVYALAAAVWAAVMLAVVIAVKGAPVYGAVVLHDATFELYVAVAVTAMVSAVIGLALSALGKSLGEVLPLLVPVILAAVLFNGSLVQLVSMWGLQQISWLIPARWGFAASASTVNLRRIDPLAANAETWTHYSGWWVFDMVMLVLFGVAAAGVTLYRLRSPGKIRSAT